MTRESDSTANSLEERKKHLIAEGALYRSRFHYSKDVVAANLHAESLAKAAVNHLMATAYTAFAGSGGLKGLNLQSILPLLISGVSILSKRSLIKPLFRGVLVIATLGVTAKLLLKKRKPRA